MEAPPTNAGAVDEVSAGEQVKDVAGLAGVDTGEGSGAPEVDVRSGGQAEQGEDMCGVGG